MKFDFSSKLFSTNPLKNREDELKGSDCRAIDLYSHRGREKSSYAVQFDRLWSIDPPGSWNPDF